MMKRILTVVGARPQFIKAAAVSRHIDERGRFEEILVHTGQHYDGNMSDIFFEELNIPAPGHHLNVGSGTHAWQTGKMMMGLEKLAAEIEPDLMMVYGDTNSTIAGALVAAKQHIALAHVEAGLRSFNMRMPEEVNRIVTDRLSTLLFCPTASAVENLRKEGLTDDRIHLVGDVMYDACLNFSSLATTKSSILAETDLEGRRYVLATVHRAENTDDPLRLNNIFASFSEISSTIEVVIPLHPRTRKKLGDSLPSGIRFIEPVGYLDMIELQRNATLIATDSGGVQKEAYFHRVPCITLRTETEWLELVETGWNRLVDPRNREAVLATLYAAVNTPEFGSQDVQLYGEGKATSSICELLENELGA